MPVGATIDTSALKLTFADEFNTLSSSPDGSSGTWKTTYAWGNRTLGSNGEQQYYSDASVGIDPFTVVNGVLDITAAPGANALGLPYVSGAITTETSFSQLYGYFEIRAQMPEGQGLWPAFWLLPDDLSWPPELDVVEVLGHDPKTLYFSTHSTVQATEGTTLKVQDVSKGFHTYGAMWGPDTVTMYIDGKEVASMNTPADMHKEMYMLANLAVGGYWPGVPDASTPFPAHMLIDYVRAYAYPGTEGGTVTVTDPSQNVGAANLAPSIVAPGTLQARPGNAVALAGVSVADTWPGGSFSVTVSDTLGVLRTDAVAGVYGSGQAATSITLTGGLSAINAALSTLTYEGRGGTDWVWVSAVDPQGAQGLRSIIASPGAAAPGNGPPSPAPDPVRPDPTPPATGTNGAPVVTTPSAFGIEAGATQALAGIRFTDSNPAGTFTVMVSGDTGLLRTSADTTAVERGQGSVALTLTGTIAAINAELATLTYQAGDRPGTEWLWVSANDPGGAQGISSIVVSVTPDTGNAAPSITAPDTINTAVGVRERLAGVHVTDDNPTGDYAITVSDAEGLLWARAIDGVRAHGNGTTELRLTGELEDVNAALATLTREADPSGGTEWLWVSATDAQGARSYESIVITAQAAPDAIFA